MKVSNLDTIEFIFNFIKFSFYLILLILYFLFIYFIHSVAWLFLGYGIIQVV